MDRVLHFLESNGEVQLPLVAEARGKLEDKSLSGAFGGLLVTGGIDAPADKFKKLDLALVFQPKLKNIIGTQIADLCAYPCARYILNPGKANPAYEIVQRKIYQNGGVTGWEVAP